MSNPLALAISFGYVFVTLGLAEGLRKLFRLPVEFTRKFVHIAVGMWSWGTAALFTNRWWAIICPATFILVNYVSYKRGMLQAMASRDRSNLGTVYFPIAFVLVILIFFDLSKAVMVAALMPMTWGDSFAAIVGKRWGRHIYNAGGGTRSREGSWAMLVLSFVATLLALYFFADTRALDTFMVVIALVIAVLSTAGEAISPRGLDNLIVPAISVVVWLIVIYTTMGLVFPA